VEIIIKKKKKGRNVEIWKCGNIEIWTKKEDDREEILKKK